MMDQYAMMKESAAARMQRESLIMAASRSINPLATLLGHIGPTFVHGPYESQSMNRKLADAKKYLASRG